MDTMILAPRKETVRILVELEDGCVSGVYCDNPDAEVIIIEDNDILTTDLDGTSEDIDYILGG